MLYVTKCTVKAGYKNTRYIIRIQSKLDTRTLDRRISLLSRTLMPLTKFKFSHKSTSYKNNARYRNRFTAEQRYSYIQLRLYLYLQSKLDIRRNNPWSAVPSIPLSSLILISSGFVWKLDFWSAARVF